MFKSTVFQIVLLISFALLNSCGSDKASTPNTGVTREKFGTPIILPLADEACQSSSVEYLHNLFSYTAWGNTGDIKSLFTANLNGLSSSNENGLNGNGIGASVYGGDVDYSVLPSQININPEVIKLCQNSGSYSSNSIENVVVQTSDIIKTTHDFYTTLPDSSPIEDILVWYMPKLAMVEGGRVYYQTDNAFYLNDGNLIIILPQSQEAIEANYFSGVPVYSVPMVASHEYGHHIFGSLFESSNEQYMNHKRDKLLEALKLKTYVMPSIKKVTQDSSTDAIVAFHEGVADLIAHYSLAPEKRHLTGLGCFGSNRVISDRYFADYRQKQLTEVSLKSFISGVADYDAHSQCPTDFTDSHMIGAIFAHSFDKVMSSLNLNSTHKMNYIVKWAKVLEEDYSDHQTLNTKEYFQKSTWSFISLISKDFPNDKNTVCESLRADLPVIIDNCDF